jgi:hypothetical protein
MTIVYAILGIPLMLLFLTNIGDIFAKSFKFLYRRVMKLKFETEIWHKRRRARRLRRAGSIAAAAKALQRYQQQDNESRQRLLQSPALTRVDSKKRRRQSENKASDPIELRQLDRHSVQVRRHRSSLSSLPRKSLTPPMHRGNETEASPSHSIAVCVEEPTMEQIRVETLAQRYANEELLLRESLDERLDTLTVPLWLVFSTMLAYLMGGAMLFTLWENWSFFNSFYFCYISLGKGS